jgi:hypothetical protein
LGILTYKKVFDVRRFFMLLFLFGGTFRAQTKHFEEYRSVAARTFRGINTKVVKTFGFKAQNLERKG